MAGSGGIQTTVNTLQNPAVVGDWCDSNPRYSVDAGPFGLVAGPNGLTVGRFAWVTATYLDSDGAPSVANNFGIGAPIGFVHRENQALITTFLADSGLVIPGGYQCTLTSSGGVWVANSGTTQAQFGQKAFAYTATGLAAFAPTGTIFGGASASGSSIAAETFSVTGSIATSGGQAYSQPSILTVTAVGSGILYAGASIAGTGIPTNPAPQIVGQITPLLAGETTGGIGRYALNLNELTTVSETITGTYGLLTVGTLIGAAAFAVGDQLTGTGVVAGTSITALGGGTGGTGTYIVNNNTVVASTTITASVAVETKFWCWSSGLPGELVKISAQSPIGT